MTVCTIHVLRDKAFSNFVLHFFLDVLLSQMKPGELLTVESPVEANGCGGDDRGLFGIAHDLIDGGFAHFGQASLFIHFVKANQDLPGNTRLMSYHIKNRLYHIIISMYI